MFRGILYEARRLSIGVLCSTTGGALLTARTFLFPSTSRPCAHSHDINCDLPCYATHSTPFTNRWYQDALQQKGVSAADLKALLAADDSEKALTATSTDAISSTETAAKQVAEQHKIMAIHRARKLLEESLGHTYVPPPPLDLNHHHHRRPSSSDALSSPLSSSPSYQPHLVLPELPKRTTALESLAARQTCLIPPNVPINISMDERNPIRIDPSDEPDVQMGVLVPEGSVATRGTIVVRCNSCSGSLRVSLKSTLVRCPSCRELSPASDRPVPTVATATVMTTTTVADDSSIT